MRWKSNYFEIQDLIIQFANAFDSIVIGRYNKNRVQKENKVLDYSNKLTHLQFIYRLFAVSSAS